MLNFTVMYGCILHPHSCFQGNDPTAFSVLTQALTGQMVLMDTEYCATCGEKGADKKCSYCKMVPCVCIFMIINSYFNQNRRSNDVV